MSISSQQVEASAGPHGTGAQQHLPPGETGPGAERPDSEATTVHATVGGTSASSGHGEGRQTRWVWNLPLLGASVLLIAIGVPALAGLHYWQSLRIGQQLLQLADLAAADENAKEEAQWLRRYLSLNPEDSDAQVRYAWAFDATAESGPQIDQSRRYLTRALTAIEGGEQADTEQSLRRRLIERLLQLGGTWFIEAEREIVKLNAPSGDPEVLEQLARSLLGQEATQVPRSFPSDPPKREEHFWRWAAAQPLAEVVKLAVEANPESVDLTAALIGSYLDHPERFAGAPGTPPADAAEFKTRATELVQRLSARTDDGHAQWTALYYTGHKQLTTSVLPLAVLADAAQQRLVEQAKSWETQEQATKRGGDDGSSEYQPLWDAQLVLAHAGNLAAAGALDAAEQLYQLLVGLPQGMLASYQLEPIYFGLGQAQWKGGDVEAARQTFETGNQRIGTSLLLLDSVAALSAATSSPEEARRDVDRLDDAIQATSVRMAARNSLSNSRRDELQNQINNASWRVDMLRAQFESGEGRHRQAAQRLERILASQLTVGNELRLAASEMLAAIYGEQGLWDLAGRVLDEAAVLAPANRQLKRQAAVAWQQASAAPRALEQWRLADDGSFEIALATAIAAASDLSIRPPAQRNRQTLVAAITEAQSRLDHATSLGRSPADAWRLDLLRLSLPADLQLATYGPTSPPSGSSPTASITGGMQARPSNLLELSEQFPEAAPLRALAILQRDRNGEAAAADKALQRLTEETAVDPVLLLELQARLAVQRNQVDLAVALLREAAGTHSLQQPRIVQFAVPFLTSIGHPGSAIELLLALTPEDHTTQTLLLLGDLLLTTDDSSPMPTGPSADALPAGLEITEELRRVEDALRQHEGAEGTHWRLLQANRLLKSIPSQGTQRRRHLTQLAALHAEIAQRRPRWHRTLELGGKIAAVQGDHRQAVNLLRRSIAEGNKGIGTVMLLVQQLNNLGEVAAAEQELARLAGMIDSVGSLSQLSINLALGQGDFQNALQRARAGVAARPDDADALLVLAQAATAAAQNDSDQRDSLHQEAGDALERAAELTGGRDLGVWQGRFRFAALTGGSSAAREVLEAMSRSELAEPQRLLAVAGGYLTLRDWEQTRAWLEKAKQASPSDPGVALAQAELFRATQQGDLMIAALEDAHRLAPQRQDIRRRLARALAASGQAEIPWQRIGELIGNQDAGATEADQLHHALLLISHGGQSQIQQARDLLSTLIQSEDSPTANDATRLLIQIERRRWQQAAADEDVKATAEALGECRRLYEQLVQQGASFPADLFGYADLLLRADQVDEAKRLASQLASVAPTSLGTLELQLRLARASGEAIEPARVVEAWLKRPGNDDPLKLPAATQVLFRLGLAPQAIGLLDKAYQADPTRLKDFVTGLAQAGEFSQAIEVCLKHYRQHRSHQPITLIAAVAVQGLALDALSDEVERVLDEAVQEFPTEFSLLEAVATLRLTQQRYSDAVTLYRQTEKINPVSLVTLNNLAVALVEIPGQQAEALLRIQRAVEIYGRNPELLDTLGMVQLRGEMLAAAEATLREAYRVSGAAHHLFHLILALDASNKLAEVERLWPQLELDQLKNFVMSPYERERLESLRQRMAAVEST